MSEGDGTPPALDLREYDLERVVLPVISAGVCLFCIVGWRLVRWELDDMFGFALTGGLPLPLALLIDYWPCMVSAAFILLSLRLPADDPDKPRSFRQFVEDAYGVTCPRLPECKPKDGSCLRIGLWKAGGFEWGWLTVEDNKVIIETTDGRYLKPLDEEEDK